MLLWMRTLLLLLVENKQSWQPCLSELIPLIRVLVPLGAHHLTPIPCPRIHLAMILLFRLSTLLLWLSVLAILVHHHLINCSSIPFLTWQPWDELMNAGKEKNPSTGTTKNTCAFINSNLHYPHLVSPLENAVSLMKSLRATPNLGNLRSPMIQTNLRNSSYPRRCSSTSEPTLGSWFLLAQGWWSSPHPRNF